MSETSRRDLVSLAPPREYPAGFVLMRQGEPRTHLFLLRSGRPDTSACVKVTVGAASGSQTLLGIRTSGDIVGELAALRRAPRSATVTTCTATIAHLIPHQVFIDFLGRRPEGWEALCRMIADRLDWANRRRLDFAGYDIQDRLARVLLEMAERHGRPTSDGHDLGVRLSQEEMGQLIGAKPDAVGLAMRQLRATGLVSSAYRKVTITDLGGLRAFAGES